MVQKTVCRGPGEHSLQVDTAYRHNPAVSLSLLCPCLLLDVPSVNKYQLSLGASHCANHILVTGPFNPKTQDTEAQGGLMISLRTGLVLKGKVGRKSQIGAISHGISRLPTPHRILQGGQLSNLTRIKDTTQRPKKGSSDSSGIWTPELAWFVFQ